MEKEADFNYRVYIVGIYSRNDKMSVKYSFSFFCLGLILLLCMALPVFAVDEYVIGPEDELEIVFWQVPEQNQTVTVRQDGKITLSIIGEIQAAGQTAKNLAEKIERDVSLYDKRISQATVTVIEYNSQKVFIAGQIGNPGKMTFEVIPDVWTIIKEAGGATDLGDLTRVSIIKSTEGGGEVITVNVLEAIATGTIDNLPKIVSGNTIEIPRAAGGVPGRQLASDFIERKNLFYIYGEVISPGNKSFEGEMDILDALGTAGGFTADADLNKVKIISKNASGTTVLHANLNDYKINGQAKRILIKREDTIVIGQKGRSFISWENLRDLAAVTTSIVTLYLLVDRNSDSNR
ncbi:MAG: polysaccharide biosynthesis/export family protein [candidate division Zixibacteria bacterium]|nr:polysaccharide biosynthesis/export family protein [candidate division Zixibacteria bacterium]